MASQQPSLPLPVPPQQPQVRRIQVREGRQIKIDRLNEVRRQIEHLRNNGRGPAA